MSRALIEITRDILAAQTDAVFDMEETTQRIDDLIAERYDKENGMTYLYGEMEGEITLMSSQKKKLDSYIKMLKNSQERLKAYVVGQYAATKELPSTDIFNPIKIVNSSGSVDVTNESAIPEEYWIEVTTKKLDKKRILKELKDGVDIPGCSLKKNQYVRGIK